jgi:hypothetical protein
LQLAGRKTVVFLPDQKRMPIRGFVAIFQDNKPVSLSTLGFEAQVAGFLTPKGLAGCQMERIESLSIGTVRAVRVAENVGRSSMFAISFAVKQRPVWKP